MKPRSKMDVLIVGGGALGTTLAHLLCERGVEVRLWMRRAEQADELNGRHTNTRYLPDVALCPRLKAVTDLGPAVRGAPVVLMAIPSRHFREVARKVGDHLEGDQVLVHGSKGIEIASGMRMSEILRQETCARKIGVLSGPNLSRELVEGRPAGAVIASRYDEVSRAVQALFAGTRLRTYAGTDVVGVEVGGAYKNVVALAAGAAEGLGLGDNGKALLLTRGLAEMARFGAALGADPATFSGLAGIGDLAATCYSALSRNHEVGRRLAAGEGIDAILASMVHVAEGVPTSEAVVRMAGPMGLDLPIARVVDAVLREGLAPGEAVDRLMSRPVGREGTWARDVA